MDYLSPMKRQSYNLPNHAHFLTFSCYRRQQFLTSDHVRSQLLQSWESARRDGRFAIWSYVIMPEHIHVLVYPHEEQYETAAILRRLKESFAREIVKYWELQTPHMLGRITVQRGARVVRRFWQEGGGYDRNLFDWSAIGSAMDYIEWNPVRRGLVRDPLDWKWSSARARVGCLEVPFAVDPMEVEVPSSGGAH